MGDHVLTMLATGLLLPVGHAFTIFTTLEHGSRLARVAPVVVDKYLEWESELSVEALFPDYPKLGAFVAQGPHEMVRKTAWFPTTSYPDFIRFIRDQESFRRDMCGVPDRDSIYRWTSLIRELYRPIEIRLQAQLAAHQRLADAPGTLASPGRREIPRPHANLIFQILIRKLSRLRNKDTRIDVGCRVNFNKTAAHILLTLLKESPPVHLGTRLELLEAAATVLDQSLTLGISSVETNRLHAVFIKHLREFDLDACGLALTRHGLMRSVRGF